jgi:hypothetical protein
MDPRSVPAELYLSTHIAPDVAAGSVNPEETTALLRAKLLIWTVVVDVYCPDTYTLPVESVATPLALSTPVPLRTIDPRSVPVGLYLSTNNAPVALVDGNVKPEL